MKKTKAEWKELCDQFMLELRPGQWPVAIKFIKTQEEFDSIPNLKYFQNPGTGCKAIGMASHFKMTVGITRDKFMTSYCAINCACAPKDKDWHDGVLLSSPPFQWHHDQQDAIKQMKAMEEFMSDEIYIGMACSALCDCEIEEPDVLALQLPAAASYHLMAGFVESDYQKVYFPFIGESQCIDTWHYTLTTGKPGLSLGCRGDRATGGLQAGEVRITMTVEDFEKALEGVRTITANGIDYPYFQCNMLKDDF